MNANNNFKRLAELENDSKPSVPEHVESNVKQTLGMASYVGNIFDLYIPKLINLVVAFLGGQPEDKNEPKWGSAPDRIEDSEVFPRGGK